MAHDSTESTKAHIQRVRDLLMQVINDLSARYWAHDRSKLIEPEKSMFDEYTERLSNLEYGTPEYEAVRQEMLGSALAHHYAENDHHPEHWPNGIADMGLVEMLEMLVDWKAAGERHAGGGDLRDSIEKNAGRFGYGDEIKRLLLNTADHMGLL